MAKKEKNNVHKKDIELPKREDRKKDSLEGNIEKARDVGRKEWISENSEESYRPIKDDLGSPPSGDEAE